MERDETVTSNSSHEVLQARRLSFSHRCLRAVHAWLRCWVVEIARSISGSSACLRLFNVGSLSAILVPMVDLKCLKRSEVGVTKPNRTDNPMPLPQICSLQPNAVSQQ